MVKRPSKMTWLVGPEVGATHWGKPAKKIQNEVGGRIQGVDRGQKDQERNVLGGSARR